mmetsp:Transcript_11376/g.27737  ORF Transcript_11376/g.27737 Transcript_11376/m.27737 type:complete len:221 (+) Transcript_11376:53-715(+)
MALAMEMPTLAAASQKSSPSSPSWRCPRASPPPVWRSPLRCPPSSWRACPPRPRGRGTGARWWRRSRPRSGAPTGTPASRRCPAARSSRSPGRPAAATSWASAATAWRASTSVRRRARGSTPSGRTPTPPRAAALRRCVPPWWTTWRLCSGARSSRSSCWRCTTRRGWASRSRGTTATEAMAGVTRAACTGTSCCGGPRGGGCTGPARRRRRPTATSRGR